MIPATRERTILLARVRFLSWAHDEEIMIRTGFRYEKTLFYQVRDEGKDEH